MKMRRKLICTLLAAMMTTMLFGGCGQKEEESEYDIFEDYVTEDAIAQEDMAQEEEWSFYGCWKNENYEVWVIFFEDNIYEMYWGEDETGMRGTYEVYDDEIRTDAGPRYVPDQDGNLISSSGDTLYRAEPPIFSLNIFFDEEDTGSDGDASYDEEGFESEASGLAGEFAGCWEYQGIDRWLYVYDDGTYEWYDNSGFEYGGGYTVEDGILYLAQDDLSFEVKDGGIVDNNDNLMFSSMLPDYDGTAMVGAEDFIGCWEDITDDLWLEIYSDGTYLFMWDDGYGSAGHCYMDGDELCLQSGARFFMDYASDMIVSDEYTMFRSEMPEHLQP